MKITAIVCYLSLAFALLSEGCAHVDETRAALVLIGEIGEPAYDAAYTACEALHHANPDHEALRTCDRVTDALEVIARLHNKAATAFENGDVEQAQKLIADVRKAWASMRGDK